MIIGRRDYIDLPEFDLKKLKQRSIQEHMAARCIAMKYLLSTSMAKKF